MTTSNPPFKVKIASPCPARWEDMGGDDRVRFCDHCRKNVYNLSALAADEARELLAAKNGNLCARIYQRADGTVLTEDCTVGLARYWRRMKIVMGAGIAAIFCAVNYVTGEPASLSELREETISTLQSWLGLNPPRIVLGGKISVSTPLPSSALLGIVARPQSPDETSPPVTQSAPTK